MEPKRPPRDYLIRAIRPGNEFRESEQGTPTMVGHFAVFNQWTEIRSSFEGHFMERIAPGAFTKAFQEPQRSEIKPVFQHGEDHEMGDKVLGLPSVLEQDKVGARYEVPLFEGIPPLIMAGIRGGAYDSSFKFSVLREHYEPKTRASAYNPDALPERTVQEVQVYDFGPVTWGAYPTATTGMRSVTDRFMRSRLLRDLGLSDEEMRRLLQLPDLAEVAIAPSMPDAADEPHLEPERSEPPVAPPVAAAIVNPRFHTREDFHRWLTSRT